MGVKGYGSLEIKQNNRTYISVRVCLWCSITRAVILNTEEIQIPVATIIHHIKTLNAAFYNMSQWGSLRLNASATVVLCGKSLALHRAPRVEINLITFLDWGT